jgi:hypothetical protein
MKVKSKMLVTMVVRIIVEKKMASLLVVRETEIKALAIETLKEINHIRKEKSIMEISKEVAVDLEIIKEVITKIEDLTPMKNKSTLMKILLKHMKLRRKMMLDQNREPIMVAAEINMIKAMVEEIDPRKNMKEVKKERIVIQIKTMKLLPSVNTFYFI